MRTSRGRLTSITSIALSGALCTAALAQPPEPPPRATEIPQAGFWPTQVMIDRALDRISEEMAAGYEFDEYQLEQTRELLDRLPAWANRNRAEIQTLMNQFFEAQLNDEPPEPNTVAIWSQRVIPLVREFEQIAVDIGEDMRVYLTDEQQVLLDGNMAAFTTGVGMMENKLVVWAEGGYDPETEWIHRDREAEEAARAEIEAEEARRIREMSDAEAAADSRAAASQPAEPSDEWAIYVQEFAKRYQFNDVQMQKAGAFLYAAQQRRDAYLKSRADQIDRVTRALEQAETPEARETAQAEFDKLNEPVERIFTQLKEKLDTLPTRQQRRDAAERTAQQQTGTDGAAAAEQQP